MIMLTFMFFVRPEQEGLQCSMQRLHSMVLISESFDGDVKARCSTRGCVKSAALSTNFLKATLFFLSDFASHRELSLVPQRSLACTV